MAATPKEIVLTDIRMPFWRMVVVIFKFTLAAIPAAILVAIVLFLLQVLVGLIGIGGLGWLMGTETAGGQ